MAPLTVQSGNVGSLALRATGVSAVKPMSFWVPATIALPVLSVTLISTVSPGLPEVDPTMSDCPNTVRVPRQRIIAEMASAADRHGLLILRRSPFRPDYAPVDEWREVRSSRRRRPTAKFVTKQMRAVAPRLGGFH